MTFELSKRASLIKPFHVMDLLARAREMEAQGRSVIHLEVGEPDFPTPPAVVEEARQVLSGGKTRYTPATGLPELRQALADWYRTCFGIDVDPRRIVITPGASGALMLALAVMLDAGDKVVMTDPGYPCNRNFVRILGGETVAVPVGPEHNYQLTPGQLEQIWQPDIRVVMLASPSNPTGTLIEPATLRALHDFVRARNAVLLVDEIYQGLVYDSEPVTALSLAGDLCVINSFSKYFCMTGWRLGWMVVPENWVDDIDRLAQNLFLAPPTVAQYAALEALKPATVEILEQYRSAFAARRDYFYPALQQIGFRVETKPAGAFYLYADCSAFTNDSFRFVEDLLEQTGVAITPGLDFGTHRAGEHVRLAYASDIPVLEEAVQRIGEFVNGQH